MHPNYSYVTSVYLPNYRTGDYGYSLNWSKCSKKKKKNGSNLVERTLSRQMLPLTWTNHEKTTSVLCSHTHKMETNPVLINSQGGMKWNETHIWKRASTIDLRSASILIIWSGLRSYCNSSQQSLMGGLQARCGTFGQEVTHSVWLSEAKRRKRWL